MTIPDALLVADFGGELMDLLTALGAWSLRSFWVPVLAWTVAAVVTDVGLRVTGPAPLLKYRIRQALLFALPIAVLASWLPVGGVFSFAPSSGIAETTRLPEVQVTAGEEGAWGLALMGGCLLAAAAVAAWGWTRLVLRVVHLRGWIASLPLRPSNRGHDLAGAWLKRIGSRRSVRVVETSKDVVPTVIPGWTPTLVLPETLFDDPDAASLVVAHECAHVAQADPLLAVLEEVTATTFRAHPLTRSLQYRISATREEACDAVVVHHARDRRRQYATLLLQFASPTEPPRVAAGLSLSQSTPTLKTRIRAMKTSTAASTASGWTLFVTALLGVALLVGACADGVSPDSSSGVADAQPETAQKGDATSGTEDVVSWDEVDTQPKIKGGIAAFQKNVIYPEIVARAGIEGKVLVQFVVDENGAVTQEKVVESVHDDLDKAALIAVRKTEFAPARKDGQPVKAQLVLPVTFSLD